MLYTVHQNVQTKHKHAYCSESAFRHRCKTKL